MASNNKQEQILTGLSTNTSSLPFDIDQFANSSAQVSWINGAAFSATAVLQGSNDLENWSDFPGASGALSGVSGNYIFDLANSGVSYIRVDIRSISGSADAQIDFNAKVVSNSK